MHLRESCKMISRGAPFLQLQSRLQVDYYRLVFSVPNTLMWQNQKVLFRLLFETSAEKLLKVALTPNILVEMAS
jgi:hypothetical protein